MLFTTFLVYQQYPQETHHRLVYFLHQLLSLLHADISTIWKTISDVRVVSTAFLKLFLNRQFTISSLSYFLMTFSLDHVYFLGDLYKLNKAPSHGTCWGNLPEAFVMLVLFYPYWTFLRFLATFPCLRHSFLASQGRQCFHQLWTLYPDYFRLLYFCQAFPSHFYRERYGFERVFFTHRCFLRFTPSPHCGIFCDTDEARNTPFRIFLSACPILPADAWSWTTHIVDTRPLAYYMRQWAMK